MPSIRQIRTLFAAMSGYPRPLSPQEYETLNTVEYSKDLELFVRLSTAGYRTLGMRMAEDYPLMAAKRVPIRSQGLVLLGLFLYLRSRVKGIRALRT